MEENNWTIRTNIDLREIHNDSDLAGSIKLKMINEHVLGMFKGWMTEESRKASWWETLRGRPRMRWLNKEEIELRQLGVRGWRRRAQGRKKNGKPLLPRPRLCKDQVMNDDSLQNYKIFRALLSCRKKIVFLLSMCYLN